MTRISMPLPLPMRRDERPKIGFSDADGATKPVDRESAGFDPAPNSTVRDVEMRRHVSDREETNLRLVITAKYG